MYMIHIELNIWSMCEFHVDFNLIPKIEENKMYEIYEEIIPYIAISDHKTNRMKLLKVSLEYSFMLTHWPRQPIAHSSANLND